MNGFLLGSAGTCLQNAIAEKRKVPCYSVPIQIPPCGSGARVRAAGTCDVRELFPDLEIADAHQLSRITVTRRPNIAIDVLRHSNHQSKRLVIWFGETAEAPSLNMIQAVIHSHPQVSGAVFEHGSDLMTRKTIPGAN